MEIAFLGMNTVRLTGKDIAVLCDPYPKGKGLPELKASADVTLLTSVLPDGAELPPKAGMAIDNPGEYELKGSMITGIPARLHTDEPNAPKSSTIYSMLIDGIRIAYLGNIEAKLSNDQVEGLNQPDVVILPVGGHGLTLDAGGASELISRLEPKYVVPTHFSDDSVTYDMPQDPVDVFLKEVGATAEPQPRLRIQAKDLPAETTIVVLQRQGS